HDEPSVRHHEMLWRDGAVDQNDDLSAVCDRCDAEPCDTGLCGENSQQERDERGHRGTLLPVGFISRTSCLRIPKSLTATTTRVRPMSTTVAVPTVSPLRSRYCLFAASDTATMLRPGSAS